MYPLVTKQGKLTHLLDDEDQCQNCKHFNNGCVLMEALAHGMVGMNQEFVIQNCTMYQAEDIVFDEREQNKEKPKEPETPTRNRKRPSGKPNHLRLV